MERGPVVLIVLSGSLFGLSVPFSKLLIGDIPSIILAGLLYIGVFLGLALYSVGRRALRGRTSELARLDRMDLPYLISAIFCGGCLAPIMLMTGLEHISGSSASLLLNLEGVLTALLAVLVFHEAGGRKLWFALTAMTLASVVLSYDPGGGDWSWTGTLLIVGAMAMWGVDNNLTQKISMKDPVVIVMLKGIVAGSVTLSLGLLLGQHLAIDISMGMALAIGAVCYGISMLLFVVALMHLGSCRTGAFFSVGPFVGAVASVIILGDNITLSLILAGILMAVGVYIITREEHAHEHYHERVEHDHPHDHDDIHHDHHDGERPSMHGHPHVHPEEVHTHAHWPDVCHRHDH